MSLAWVDRYMAVPFKDGGRTISGADCFGLYALVVRERFGARLHEPGVSYGRDSDAVAIRVADEIASDAWVLVVEGDGLVSSPVARCGDAVVMTGHVRTGSGGVVRADVHLGVALGGGLMLHTERPAGPRVVQMEDPRVAKRIRGVWRPRALVELGS